jgi:ribosomal protein S18 acetylase RimI-like enzyme
VHDTAFSGSIEGMLTIATQRDALTTLAFDDQTIVGFKMGHGTSRVEFNSCMGCVHPDFQGRGIAMRMTTIQREP